VPRGTETVLLVEDEATVRAFARQALESCGYRVLVAADPAEALRVAERADLLQLLLTDVVLPGMSGHDLGRQLRRARPGLRVLLTSGYAETLLHERDDVVPDVAFLPKPYTLERLATMVRQVLDMPA
jgi:CheY-like chemotaxis protein